jgi:hypothetical protein
MKNDNLQPKDEEMIRSGMIFMKLRLIGLFSHIPLWQKPFLLEMVLSSWGIM